MTRPGEEGLPIFDVSGLKLVGRVVAEDGRSTYLEWPAQLSFRSTPVLDNQQQPAGDQFDIQAVLSPFMPEPKRYKLPDAAVRGQYYEYGAWLKKAYGEFVARAETGAYGLIPKASVIATKVTMPATEQEEVAVSTGEKVALKEVPPPAASSAADSNGA